MTFSIQEEVLLSLLDTKFHLLTLQNGGMMANCKQAFDHNNFAGKGPFLKIMSHISICVYTFYLFYEHIDLSLSS